MGYTPAQLTSINALHTLLAISYSLALYLPSSLNRLISWRLIKLSTFAAHTHAYPQKFHVGLPFIHPFGFRDKVRKLTWMFYWMQPLAMFGLNNKTSMINRRTALHSTIGLWIYVCTVYWALEVLCFIWLCLMLVSIFSCILVSE